MRQKSFSESRNQLGENIFASGPLRCKECLVKLCSYCVLHCDGELHLVADPFSAYYKYHPPMASYLHFPSSFPNHIANPTHEQSHHYHSHQQSNPTSTVQTIRPVSRPVSRAQLAKQSSKDWRCFDLFLLSRKMDRDHSIHNH